jgi:hypothetical protein
MAENASAGLIRTLLDLRATPLNHEALCMRIVRSLATALLVAATAFASRNAAKATLL